MHVFPQHPISRQKWEHFVRNERSNWTHANSTICGTHFVTPDDFDGCTQWKKMCYKTQLDLKKSAILSKNTNKAPRYIAIILSTATPLLTPSSTASRLHCDVVPHQYDRNNPSLLNSCQNIFHHQIHRYPC